MYETSKITRENNPRERANVFSLLTFLYTADIFKKAKNRDLEEDDIYNTVTNCRSETLGDILEKLWTKEKRNGRLSLTRTLWSIFGWEYAYYGFLSLIIKTPLAVIIPYATGILVSYFEPDSTTTINKAIFCGSVLIICGILNATYNKFYHVTMNRLGLQIEISLCALMYRKAIKLTQKSLCEVTSGRIVTLMAVDSLIANAASLLFLNNLWIGILQVVIILGVMYHRIGMATLVSTGFLMAVIPIQMWLGVKMRQLCLRTLALTDERLRRIQEILTSIRLIKLYCWENFFTKIVHTLRIKEMIIVRNTYFLTAIMLSLSSLSYRFSYFLCVFAYYLLGNNISAEELFFLVSCYKYLDDLVSIAIPGNILLYARGRSSLARIKTYLLMPEINESGVSEGKNTGDGIQSLLNDGREMENLENVNEQEVNDTEIGIKSLNMKIIFERNQTTPIKGEILNSEGSNTKIAECERGRSVNLSMGEQEVRKDAEIGNQNPEIKRRNVNLLNIGKLEQSKCENENEALLCREENGASYTNKPTIIIFERVTVNTTNQLIFNDLNLELTQPSLIGINGDVGSGKSTFLKLCINDFEANEGRVRTTGSISYASQEPWLFPGTIRQNILFGNTFDLERYREVLKVCALVKDLDGFPERDLTVVNDKGLNFSGGQQARINLARAIYKKADIYLLDDVLSSLDPNVSKYIFKHCIKIFLKGKLCLLVCQDADFLAATDKIVTLKDGGIQLTNNQMEFFVPEEDGEVVDDDFKMLETDVPHIKLYKEYKVAGKVGWKAYTKCFDLAGGWMVISPVLAICLVTQFIGILFDYYANQWLDIEAKVIESLYKNKSIIDLPPHNESTVTDVNATELNGDLALERRRVLSIYAGILIVFIVFVVIEYFSFFAMIVRATRNMHLFVFEKIMGATMKFFDTTFSGSILNRLSKDIGHVDEAVGQNYFQCIKTSFELTVIITLIIYLNPMLCIPAFIFLLVVLYGGLQFLKSSRSLRRIEPIVRAPCIGYINASLEGLTTIRATGNQKILIDQFDKHQDHYSSVVYMMFMSKHAFGYWLDLLGNFFSACIIFSFIIFHDKIENIAGNVGVAVTQAIGISSLLQSCVLNWTELENSMTASERVLEYGDAEQEATTGETPENWPKKPKIEYKDVSLQYPNSDSKILNAINFTIEPKQKIAIIGRTGAGKSSIITALFRLYEPQGAIFINDFETSNIKLKTLRSKISIIPQHPVLFKGTVRSNLDPEDLHTDLQLWNALDKVGLKTTLSGIGLLHEVEEAGLNFSIGQRQLFSLARVVLSDNGIVVFDEATANMDPETDGAIEMVVKELFAECTVITIAHRMNTVIHCDKVAVVEGGEIIEFDDPKVLLQRKTSYFNSIMKL